MGNKTYHNYRGYCSILFNFYISGQELPLKNPITKVEALTVEASELHLPFSNAQLSSIQETLLQKGDKQLFISFIHYTLARPAEEVRLLQVKDIREKPIFIPSKRAKNNKGEHITIHQDLESLIEEHGLRKYPNYVFAADQQFLGCHPTPYALICSAVSAGQPNSPGADAAGRRIVFTIYRGILHTLFFCIFI